MRLELKTTIGLATAFLLFGGVSMCSVITISQRDHDNCNAMCEKKHMDAVFLPGIGRTYIGWGISSCHCKERASDPNKPQQTVQTNRP